MPDRFYDIITIILPMGRQLLPESKCGIKPRFSVNAAAHVFRNSMRVCVSHLNHQVLHAVISASSLG
jgi:hypothetical protein